jgi:hypothetical protein
MGQPVQSSGADQYAYSHAVQGTIEVAFPIAQHMTWDAYIRLLYDKADKALRNKRTCFSRAACYPGSGAWQRVIQRHHLTFDLADR